MRHRGQNSTGGAPRKLRYDPDERRVPVEAPPSTLALLRGIYALRRRLEPRELEKIESFLQRARSRALTPAQLAAAIQIGRSVGVGYDAPDTAGDPPTTSSAQPWGPLPMRPPGCE